MRVIETFVTSVPREKIPADAKWFMQDKGCGVLMYQIGGASPKISQTGCLIFTDVKCDVRCHDIFPLSTDAAETVVTREELMRAYDLVDQGYTLWFGGECPVDSRNTRVDWVCSNGYEGANCKAWVLSWKSETIIAYRLSRSVDKDVAAPLVEPVTDKLEARLKKLDNITGGVWPVSDDEKLLVTADDQLIRFEPEKLITRAQWDDYVSRKIRVGDKVKIEYAGTNGEVLYVGNRTVFIRLDDGHEVSAAPEYLTRIPQ